MKILFLTSTLGYGGAAKMLAFAANGFSSNGDSVSVVAYKARAATPSFDDSISLRLLGNELDGKGHIAIIYRLREEIQIISPDVIVSFLSFPNFYAVILGKLLHIPVVISERGNPFIAADGFKMKLIYAVMNMADGAVFQTEGAKMFFSQRLQRRAAVIPNPVVKRNTEVCYDVNCNNHEIVCVGRLENAQKRIDLLIDAMGIVVQSFPDAKLIIYGNGQDEDMLKALALSRDYKTSIYFMGPTADPEKVMAKSEVYVITSDYEGIPNTLIEAMSIGMPVVATDCDPGGARLLVQDGINGFLVSKSDVHALAEKILLLLSNKAKRQELSTNALNITSSFSESRIMNLWVKYLKSLVNCE